jgi:antitoxin component YwqK of YwqJK toxin-antitoxin module
MISQSDYYEDGSVKQEGTYKDGKLHGEWISYEQNGKKNAIAQYKEGDKTGKWFFWANDILTEVDYNSNIIAEVKSYKNTRTLVNRN